MKLPLLIPFFLTSLNVQSLDNSFINDNLNIKATLVAQQTCGMESINELETNFPMGSIVNDGYATYKVIGYSPSFAAVQGVQVDIYGNPVSETGHWLCARTLRVGAA